MIETYVFHLVNAYQAANRPNSSFAAHWEELFDQLEKMLPSGSGFDNGTQILSISEKHITFGTAFHHMDEHGYYDGWTEHRVKVTPTLLGISIKVSGPDRNSIKDYISDVFYHLMCQKFELDYSSRKFTRAERIGCSLE